MRYTICRPGCVTGLILLLLAGTAVWGCTAGGRGGRQQESVARVTPKDGVAIDQTAQWPQREKRTLKKTEEQ